MENDPVLEITPDMINAGMEALATWKQEDDFVSEKQAVTEIFTAMLRLSRPSAQPQNPIGLV